jgi:hypothetical protein
MTREQRAWRNEMEAVATGLLQLCKDRGLDESKTASATQTCLS